NLKRSASKERIICRICSLVGLPSARAWMSNLSDIVQLGSCGTRNCALFPTMSYAKKIYVTSGKFVAEKRPPLGTYMPPALRGKFEDGGASDLLGLTEVTSNANCFPSTD